MSGSILFVEACLKHKKVVMFGKTYSPETTQIKDLLAKNYYYALNENVYTTVDIERRQDCSSVEDYLMHLSGYNNREVPLLFVKGKIVGGYMQIVRLHHEDRLKHFFAKIDAPSDEEEDEKEGEEIAREDNVRRSRPRRSEVIVRLSHLDDTEVVVRVAQWLYRGSSRPTVDYDYLDKKESQNSTLSALYEIRRASFIHKMEKRHKPLGPEKKAPSEDDLDPEWVYVGGKRNPSQSSTNKGKKEVPVPAIPQNVHKEVQKDARRDSYRESHRDLRREPHK